MSFSLAVGFNGLPPGTCYPGNPEALLQLFAEQLQITGF